MRMDIPVDGRRDIWLTWLSRVIATITPMQNASGGFGAGHGHISHSLASYAAVLSLLIVGGDEALGLIDRKSM
jgi:protein farnesyltransferase subunit beta